MKLHMGSGPEEIYSGGLFPITFLLLTENRLYVFSGAIDVKFFLGTEGKGQGILEGTQMVVDL